MIAPKNGVRPHFPPFGPKKWGLTPFFGALLLALSIGLHAQQYPTVPDRPAPPPAPANARAAAPIDLTGYWVSLITDDWRWRVVTPRKGDYLYLPLNPEGRRAADTWDPATDEAAGEQCRGYGAPSLMHLPGRLHITWDGDHTLKVEADAGTQTRVFTFEGGRPARELTSQATEPTWQGVSVAQWEFAGGGGGRRGRMGGGGTAAGGPRPGSSLKVETRRMRPGYVRKNGIPYSANAVLTEYFARITEPNGDEYLIVTNFLEDPQYLAQPYIRSVQFKKQPGATGWNPTPCSTKSGAGAGGWGQGAGGSRSQPSELAAEVLDAALSIR